MLCLLSCTHPIPPANEEPTPHDCEREPEVEQQKAMFGNALQKLSV